MSQFEVTSDVELSIALIIAALILNVIIFSVCVLRTDSKEANTLELNEEQFLENIERAKKGEEAEIDKPNYVMSNQEQFNEGIPKKVE